jgi:hypothetical protein
MRRNLASSSEKALTGSLREHILSPHLVSRRNTFSLDRPSILLHKLVRRVLALLSSDLQLHSLAGLKLYRQQGKTGNIYAQSLRRFPRSSPSPTLYSIGLFESNNSALPHCGGASLSTHFTALAFCLLLG